LKRTVFFYNGRLVDSRTDSPGAILVIDGTIASVYKQAVPDKAGAGTVLAAILSAGIGTDKGFSSITEASVELYDVKGRTIMPAFIDMHAHFRYPGQPWKEDLDTALDAAAAGGFGTLVLMPNTNPVISSAAAALHIDAEAAERNKSKVFQTVSLTKDFDGTDTTHLKNLDAQKIPVITEDGHDVADAAVLLAAMRTAAENGQIVSCHSENADLAAAARVHRKKALVLMKEHGTPGGQRMRVEFPDSIRKEINDELKAANELLALAEDSATERNIETAKLAGCHVHIAHVSTKRSMDAVRRAKREIADGTTPDGFSITCEVTPHHIGLCGTEPPELYELVNPPLRSEADRMALITALVDGTADVIATDHAPHSSADKLSGAPGFTGLETAFAVCNTILVQSGKMSLSRLSSVMSRNPAAILKLNKGTIAAGTDADFVLVSPEEEWIVDSSSFKSKGKTTPFEGKKLKGKVHAVVIGGVVF
jgi:dihydroorotase